MIRKELGKIKSVTFGIHDELFLFGLDMQFSGKNWRVGTGGKYLFNMEKIPEHHNFTEEERDKRIVEEIKRVKRILEDARVRDIAELMGKPIEVTFDGNLFKDFRILKEVL